MSKEACIALVCVVSAFALAAVGFTAGGPGERRSAPERPVFAGGPETGERPPARRSRPHATRVRLGGAGGAAVVRIRRGRSVALHGAPGGDALVTLDDRTPFGSQAVLPVVRRRPGWLGVISSALPNGRVGWIRDDPGALAAGRTAVRVLVDRSERRLTVFRRGRAVVSAYVGVGRSGSETPTGRFAVTDKLPGARFTSSYGCCILALSGRQSRLPAGWRGGDRLAIHGTDGRSAAGVRSAGCVTVDATPLRRLMDTVPLGTLVTVRD